MPRKRGVFLTIMICSFVLLCSCNKIGIAETDRFGAAAQSDSSMLSIQTIANSDLSATKITETETSIEQSDISIIKTPTTLVDSTVTTEGLTAVEMKKYNKQLNGIELSLYAPEAVVFGEKFHVIAKIANHTKAEITYTLPSCTPDAHLGILVSINDRRKSFVDCDTFGKPLADLTINKTLQPGEQFEEIICFLPGWSEETGCVELDKAKITMFDQGIYYGTAVFSWDVAESVERISLEFPVVIT